MSRVEKIQVVLRMRPFNNDDKLRKAKRAWRINYEKNTIWAKEQSIFNTKYQYNKIFSSTADNKKVY